MLKTICYYITDYGYGHATRSIAIIRSLFQHSGQSFRIIVCSGKALPFIQESLKEYENAISYRAISTDLGYFLQSGSIEPDLERLKYEFALYMEEWPGIIDREINFLLQEKVDLVVSDISPIPFAAADKLNMVSVGISNFTWYTAYEQMMDEQSLAFLYQAYSHMDYFLSLPGADEPDWGRLGHIQTNFFSRAASQQEVSKIKARLNPDGSKLIVYFALGMNISVNDLEEMSMWADDSCQFIVSSNMSLERSNVCVIPSEDTESQNYLAAADLVISKPGWGTVSEAVCFNKPLLLVDRKSFTEDQNTVKALTGRHSYQKMEWEMLKRTAVTRELVAAIEEQDVQERAADRDLSLPSITGFLMNLLK
ncbi:glycosyltransferase [Paenibacillus solisilvae]|uniref:Glycosyltransferase n=1 Tax=Paenibacillus solisilvae TaxID=2486751 RepID=A0ABW0W489_9BACL